jgi:hypothetical protein
VLVAFQLSRLGFLLIDKNATFIAQTASLLTTAKAAASSSNSKLYLAEQSMSDLKTTFAALNGFLEYFLSVSIAEYTKFSVVEWARLVLILQASSEICFGSPPSVVSKEHDELLHRQRAKLLIYFEALSHRLETLSQPSRSPDEPPNHHLLFNSILQVVSSAYLPESDVHSYRTVEKLSLNTDIEKTAQPRSRCPILNGQIRDTEYWNTLQNSQTVSEPSSGEVNAAAEEPDMPNFFEDVFVDSQYLSSVPPAWAHLSEDIDFNSLI